MLFKKCASLSTINQINSIGNPRPIARRQSLVFPGFEGRSYGRRLLFSRGPECRNRMEGSLEKRTLHSYVTYRSIEMLTKLLRYFFLFLAFFFVAFFLAFFFFAIILSPPFG
jgi:hypothetical protein